MGNNNKKQAFAMDWEEERINNHTQIEYFEKESLQKCKKSNKFSSFARCAYRSYKYGSYDYKMAMILHVTGRSMLLGNVDVRKLVSASWRNMVEDKKVAWKARATYLNVLANEGVI